MMSLIRRIQPVTKASTYTSRRLHIIATENLFRRPKQQRKQTCIPHSYQPGLYGMAHTAHHLHEQFEPKPDAQALTGDTQGDVDYEPHPERSLDISAEHKQIMQKIINLYSGSASEEDMQVYDQDAIYDDPFSYCDTRFKIAGQWYGLPMIFSKLRSVKTEVVKDTPTEIVWKQRHEYTPKLLGTPKAVDSLISLGLDDQGKVRYHKDMWNEKDYTHEGLSKFFKTLQADITPVMSRPPKTL